MNAADRFWEAYALVPERDKTRFFKILRDEDEELFYHLLDIAKIPRAAAFKTLDRRIYGKKIDKALQRHDGGEVGWMVFFFLLIRAEKPLANDYFAKWEKSQLKRGDDYDFETIIQESVNDPVEVFIARYIEAYLPLEQDSMRFLNSEYSKSRSRGFLNEKAVAVNTNDSNENSEIAHFDSEGKGALAEQLTELSLPDIPSQIGPHVVPSRSIIEARKDLSAEKILYRNPKHPILIHSEVFDLMNCPAHGKRLNLVLTHLAAHGRTSIVKGCKDDANRGWLRTPLSGNHYYLWWTNSHRNPVGSLPLVAGTILVRAVRHHDNHQPLHADSLEEFTDLSASDLVDERCSSQPWTETQKNFIFDVTPVRILAGNPGSGKTTALWKAVAARSDQKVLYLTWSRDLAQMAREHFDSFAGQNVEIVARDLSSFWGEILRRDIPRVELSRSIRQFKEHAAYLDASQIGEWRGRHQALHAEARSVVYGMANPLAEGPRLSLLEPDAYKTLRQQSLGAASEYVVRAVTAIDDNLKAADWIPDLEAAAQAARWIRDHGVPDGWDQFDRIVIDEVQDLTKLELKALMVFYTAVARKQERLPWLLMAGDEGQTVVPTQFKWGWLKDTIHESLKDLVDNPQTLVLDCKLDSNLRCPRNICDVLDRATALYARLPKIEKPGDQSPPSDGQVHDARLIHVVCQTHDEVIEVLGKLTTREDFVVISLEDRPDWNVSSGAKETEELASLMERILSPSSAKGLEYQSVCIINPGRKLLEIKGLAKKTERLSEMAARSLIDQFRVALSRATGDLIFLDVQPTGPEACESLDMLVNPLVTTATGLAEYYDDFDTTPEDRVRSRLKLAQNFGDSDIHRAWRLANEAMRMLGNPNMTDGVANPELRRDVSLEILTLAARLFLDRTRDKDLVSQAKNAGDEALVELANDSDRRIFTTFRDWTCHIYMPDSSDRGTVATAIDFLEALVEPEGVTSWIESVLPSCAQRLRTDLEKAAGDEICAGRMKGPVSEWLRITGEVGDVVEKEMTLRRIAFDTLMRTGSLPEAQLILDRMPEGSQAMQGRMHEAHSRFELAAEAFEDASMTKEAFRNWRQAGHWENARRLAEGSDGAHLAWLCDITTQLNAAPDGLREWMTPGENKRVAELLSKFTSSNCRRE